MVAVSRLLLAVSQKHFCCVLFGFFLLASPVFFFPFPLGFIELQLFFV